MKYLSFAAICILVLSNVLAAQTTDTFDIAAFGPPAGWKRQSKPGVLIFSTFNEQKGTYTMIMLYASRPGSGIAKSDFESDWREFVAGQLGAKNMPKIEPAARIDGWDVVLGSSSFENEMGPAGVLLSTYSGYGIKFSLAAIFNTPDDLSAIDAFASSVKLRKPDPGTSPSAAAGRQQQDPDNVTGSRPALTQHSWKQTQNRRDVGGYAGYSSNTYQFYGNNTYKFSRVDFQNFSPKYYLENEEGTYKITGNTITITPKKAAFSSHKINKEDPPSRTGALGLNTLQYSFEIILLNNNWTLLLSPVDGTETKRDGPFSFWLNGERRRTYSYNSVNAKGELIR